ncbi:hypothetical protein JCM18905_1005 [Vibrio sp. JCM 18905]|nr:hypothetical protein JCM18905_1005 [Vibrio sp. JCM 18905]
MPASQPTFFELMKRLILTTLTLPLAAMASSAYGVEEQTWGNCSDVSHCIDPVLYRR